MQIKSLMIRGFRCFNDQGQMISFDNLTCFVGPNASGKTAAMIALARLFGENNSQRQFVPSDFHLDRSEKLKDKASRNLSIECQVIFPELLGQNSSNMAAIPETFNQMIVDDPGGTPYCRIRLEATWTDDGTPMGDIESSISWILTNSEDPAIIENGNRKRMLPGDRTLIRLVYIPATRDPNQQIRTTTSSSFGLLLNALNWAGVDVVLREKLVELQEQFTELAGIKTLNTLVQKTWQGLYEGRFAKEVLFRAIEEDPSSLIKKLMPSFRPGEDGNSILADELSDGLRSLFSLSLSIGFFRAERQLKDNAVLAGFKAELVEKLPVLTVFAIEEPENHLSPQYLGRIIDEVSKVAEDDQAQVLISSHSPSILGRIKPDHVRYFLGGEFIHATRVNTIPLPESDTDEAFKYVREAVRGFPELYFARLVILGEGPSEVIVLKRLFEASGTPLDAHFISVVPLGGRHVNHFWKLLNGLEIPFITLLDLDREKEGAGWGRIQYVRDQLVLLHESKLNVLQIKGKTLAKYNLNNEIFVNFNNKSVTELTKMSLWIKYFEVNFQVFFSTPLDLDFSMLEAFPEQYKALSASPRGPRLPDPNSPEYHNAIIQRMKQVLSTDISSAPPDLGSTYDESQKTLFAWYKYMFVDGSKPVTHMRALLSIDNNTLVGQAPPVLRRMIERTQQIVNSFRTDN